MEKKLQEVIENCRSYDHSEGIVEEISEFISIEHGEIGLNREGIEEITYEFLTDQQVDYEYLTKHYQLTNKEALILLNVLSKFDEFIQ